ncbi:universal stress protein UspA [Secundilactobacillus paracollinoides]|uniref:Universal stress protein n=1 Tax=Secundilactobacillus paracollinoides TaxID=240427 RepID=A0A1B2J1M1_9LACO|nr:universal stress protein [Secundilactobacillus paracollinoides]ANZ62243.1 universal stress protein UspA [Secundilactobacillus paracollinoides]ANZ63931.1 universal stress protein UspA [Secundilactobacillus paracollinoides]ANZ68192.1 universal stress protein UspA [Secundilactobacillus paracollinoides]KRL76322.1 UspA family nucleotide-binding protein [Secundilactobacillus paracollinoides DSM 15502 = JCM 11969]
MKLSANYHHILVGVDGSKQAQRAVQKAIAVAKRNQAELTIVSVLNVSKLIGLGSTKLGFGYVDQGLLDEIKEKIERLVDKNVASAKQAGVTNVRGEVQYGNPKVELAKNLPAKFGTDLIMLGATGANVVERMMLGSNASYVVTNARCDVLIVRTDVTNQPILSQK